MGHRVRRDGTGYGAGVARYSGIAGYCAAVAEVAADTDIRVRRLWLAVDVGRVINPDGVINQVEGGAVQSASWTLREQVRFDQDTITSASWDSYPILRFTDTPEVMVRVMDAPGEAEVGAGEVAQGPVAGAIGNAVAERGRDPRPRLPLTRERVTRRSRKADLMRIDVHAHYCTEDYRDATADRQADGRTVLRRRAVTGWLLGRGLPRLTGLCDDSAHLVGAEGPHRGRADAAERPYPQSRRRRRFIVGELDNGDEVVFTGCPEQFTHTAA